MTICSFSGGCALAVLAWSAIVGGSAWASELIPPGLYDVTTQTSMPHLEENLRYATTRETRCLAHQELSTAFPVLAHPSLEGCRLTAGNRSQDEISYLLVCAGRHGTTGDALWRVSGNLLVGTLRVKLGGKNMTFSQRVTAQFLGQCD